MSVVASQETEGNEMTRCLDKRRIKRWWDGEKKKNRLRDTALFCVAAEMKSLV